MKVLLVNKFLYPNGGSETYTFKLGQYLQTLGHEVQYFGMEHEGNIVGNRMGAYTTDMDFHGSSKLKKVTYPIKTIYSLEARRKIRCVLNDFQPDVCHLNNFNYQLTPSIILEIVKWRQESHRNCNIVYTAHDYQLVCPNHMCNNPNSHQNCEKCLDGRFLNCARDKCIHGSFAKSMVGTAEAIFWKWARVYDNLDWIICCSHFMKSKIDTNPVLAEKSVVMHNFLDLVEIKQICKSDYVLYFGRYSREKGVSTLIHVARSLPDIQFVFAGSGPLEKDIETVQNIKNVGFQSGEALANLIRQARFTVYPSEWYENCPFSVMESQMYGTPVIGARIGGVPELLRDGETGELFQSGNESELRERIYSLWLDKDKQQCYAEHCLEMEFLSIKEYTCKLIGLYTTKKH